MKKQMNNILTAVSVMALLGAVSCNKEKAVETAGSAIRFGVSTVYENGPATKTEYSGKDEDNNSISDDSDYERIDWVEGDVIRIVSPQATVVGSSEKKYADYAITPETDASSKATIDPVSSGLQWGGEVSHNFFALYPSPEQNDVASISVVGDGATVTGTVPAEQSATLSGHVFKPDMDNAYMYAVAPNVSSGSSVQLDFHPLVTTLEFTLLTRAGDEITSNLTSVKLSSTQSDAYLAGNFTASLTTSGLTAVAKSNITDGSNEITINLGTGVQLSTTEAYTVTFLTLPMAQTELTLTLGFENGTKRTLKLKNSGSWITVDACKKTYIWKVDAPLTLVTYSIASAIADISQSGSGVTTGLNQDITVTVNKTVGASVTTQGAWKAYFYTSAPAVGDEVSVSWSETPLQDAGSNDWLTLSSYTGDGTGNAVSVTFTGAELSGATMEPGITATSMISALRSGAGVTDLDLSTYNILDGSTGAAETANSYVIKTHGSYLIPCVYGNAYSGGAINEGAYSNTTTGTNPLNTFINADGNAIGSAVITSDPNLTKGSNLSARVVWQDVYPGFEMITDANLEYVSTPGTAVNCPYIKVTFPQDKIVPGNVVVALYDDDNAKILWSWHLWVTTETLTTVNVLQSDNTTSHNFLNVNLGWTPPISYTARNTSARDQYVIIVCTESGKVIDFFHVSQAAYSISALTCTRYSSTYFQWGRKDPFLPSSGTGTNKAISYNTSIITPTVSSTNQIENGPAAGSTNNEKLGWMTKNPYVHSTSVLSYYNLWDAGQGGTVDHEVVKTVYDPSPRGFKLPNRNAFTGFTSDGNNSSGSNITYGDWVAASGEQPAGRNFSTTHSTSDKTFFIPVSGLRGNNNSAAVLVTNCSYNWTAALANGGEGYDLYFTASGVYLLNKSGRSYGCAVRPVQELDTNISSGANTAGQDIYNGGSVNGSWGN